MKSLFFEARYKGAVDASKIDPALLPKKIALLTTVQFLDSLETIKKELEKAGKKIMLRKGVHAAYHGQALGCSLITPIEDKAIEAFLYIGDGLFHPKQLVLKNSLPVFVYNPKSGEFFRMKTEDAERMRKKMRGALLKYHSSKRIGILVSTKPGQNKIGLARKLKQKLTEEGKEAYLFIADTIDFNELENFPFIDVFVNTACPRIAYDDSEKISRPIIDIGDLD